MTSLSKRIRAALFKLHDRLDQLLYPDSIYIRWHCDDVLSVRPDLSVEEALDVLRIVEQRHDANEGINWCVLELVAEIHYPKKNVTPDD